MMKKALFFLVFMVTVFGLFCHVHAAPDTDDDWYATGGTWTHRVAIELDSVSGSTNLTNHPVLVYETIGGLATCVSDGDCQSDGGDIVFVESDGDGGSKLDHELVSFTSGTGAIEVWVEIPSLQYDGSTYIWMYYGDDDIADQENVSGTWNADFKMVHHFAEGQAASTYADSAGNYTLTDNVSDSTVTTKIGYAKSFDGTGDYVDHGAVGQHNLNVAGTSIGWWFRKDTSGALPESMWGKRADGNNFFGQFNVGDYWWETNVSNDFIKFEDDWGNISYDTWYYMVVEEAASGGDTIAYRNGVVDDSTINNANIKYVNSYGSGNSSYDWTGDLDEIFIMTGGPQGEDFWDNLYSNMNSPTGYTSISAEYDVPSEDCTNGIDDNGNSLIDCADHAFCDGEVGPCGGGILCAATESGSLCDDGCDNDGDGLTDCEESACDGEDGDPDSDAVCESDPATETLCGDDFDNDADGYTDEGDPDCGPTEFINEFFADTDGLDENGWGAAIESNGTVTLLETHFTGVPPSGTGSQFMSSEITANSGYAYRIIDRGYPGPQHDLAITWQLKTDGIDDGGYVDIWHIGNSGDSGDGVIVGRIKQEGGQLKFGVRYYYNSGWTDDPDYTNIDGGKWYTTTLFADEDSVASTFYQSSGSLYLSKDTDSATSLTNPESCDLFRLGLIASSSNISASTEVWYAWVDLDDAEGEDFPGIMKQYSAPTLDDANSWTKTGGAADSVTVSDDDDATYFGTNGACTGFTDDTYSLTFTFADPNHWGDPLGIRGYYKGMKYGGNDMDAVVSAHYAPGGGVAQRYPDIPRVFHPDTHSWAYLEWTEDPVVWLPLTNKSANWDTNIVAGDILFADIHDGGVSGARFGVVENHTTGDHSGELEITYRINQEISEGVRVKNGYGFVVGEELCECTSAGDGGDPCDLCSSDTADVAGQYYQDPISWDTADDFMLEIRTTSRHAMPETDPGAKISEVKLITLSTNDSQEYVETIIGTGAYTNSLCFVGVTSGAADIKIRYGLDEDDVKWNDEGAFTTKVAVSTTEDGGYSYHVWVDEGDTVVDYNGDDHTVSYQADGLYGQTIYYDILVKGDSATDYISTFRLEGFSNDVWENIIPDGLPQTVAFPAVDATGDMAFVITGDAHSQDRWDLWENLADDLDPMNVVLVFDLGDTWKDCGDSLRGIRERAKWAQGLSGAPARMGVYLLRPHSKLWSDHDFLVDNGTSAGAGAFGFDDDTVRGGDFQYWRTYNALKVNLERMPYNHENLAPDYNGNLQADFGWYSADSPNSTATRLEDATFDFTSGDGSSDDAAVWPGMVVHYRNTVADPPVYGYARVASVHDGYLITTTLVDIFGNTGLAWDDTNAEYLVGRGGLWQHIVYGAIAELWLLDTRYRSSRAGRPGCDWLGSTDDGSAAIMSDVFDSDCGNCGDECEDGLGSFEYCAPGSDFGDVVVGDLVIFDRAGTDTYAHVTSVDDENDVLGLDVDTAQDGDSFSVYSCGSSDHGSYAANDAAGHKQRTWLEEGVDNSSRLAKFVSTDINLLHNAMGAAFDAACDRDTVAYVDYDRIATYGIREPMIDIESGSGTWDAGNYIKGSVSGAKARLEADGEGGDVTGADCTIVLDLDYSDACFEVYPEQPWHCTLVGEFVYDDTITEYTDIDCTLQDATPASGDPAVPGATAEFPAMDDDGDGIPDYPAYNLFHRASSLFQYIQAIFARSVNIGLLVADRHFSAINDNRTHSDEHCNQLNPGPSMYGTAQMKGSWFIDTNKDGHGQGQEEFACLHNNNVNLGAGYFVGGYGLVNIDYSAEQVTMSVYSGKDGTIIGTTEGADQPLSLTYNLTTSLVTEDFEDTTDYDYEGWGDL